MLAMPYDGPLPAIPSPGKTFYRPCEPQTPQQLCFDQWFLRLVCHTRA